MDKMDYYDIIIEKLTKEWNLQMSENNNITNPNWEVPKFSKNKVNKAGKVIAEKLVHHNNRISTEEYNEAIEILNNWRSSHAYPLQVITNNLNRNNPNAIVVQRLKRLDSIIGKIERFPDMSLYRMQDLGGCRVIVDSIEDVYESVNRFKTSRIRHIFKREDDYIQYPKESGYRSYHMVYQFQSDDNDTYNKNMLIEIQFRTKLQHIWATAVEMMGLFTQSKLKSSMGDKDILRFFTLISSLFAMREGTPICPDTVDDKNRLISEVKEIDEKLHIMSKISALSEAINQTDKKERLNKKGYFILRLDYDKRTLMINGFSTSEIELATNIYNKLEANNDDNMDTVLVSAQSFTELKEAYPNYFTDIRKFTKIMTEIIQ